MLQQGAGLGAAVEASLQMGFAGPQPAIDLPGAGSGLPPKGWGFFNRHYGDFCTGTGRLTRAYFPTNCGNAKLP